MRQSTKNYLIDLNEKVLDIQPNGTVVYINRLRSKVNLVFLGIPSVEMIMKGIKEID